MVNGFTNLMSKGCPSPILAWLKAPNLSVIVWWVRSWSCFVNAAGVLAGLTGDRCLSGGLSAGRCLGVRWTFTLHDIRKGRGLRRYKGTIQMIGSLFRFFVEISAAATYVGMVMWEGCCVFTTTFYVYFVDQWNTGDDIGQSREWEKVMCRKCCKSRTLLHCWCYY